MDECSMNETATECSVGEYTESIVPPILQFVFGFIGNALAIFLLIKTKKSHQWKSFYRLVFALALTDSTISCLVYPVVLRRYASNFTHCLSDYECKHIAFIQSSAFLGSALLVTSMSIDRCLAIVFPTVYQRISKPMKTMIFIFGSLFLAVVVCALPLAGVGQYKVYYPGSWCFIDFTSKDIGNKTVTYIYSILGVITFSLTAILNTIVMISLIRRILHRKKKFGRMVQLKSDIYIVVLLFGIVTVFSVCWIPLTTRMLYNLSIDCQLDGKTELLVVRLAVTNSIVDPFIYIVLRKENFEYLERLIRRFKRNVLSMEIHSNGNVGQAEPSVSPPQSVDISNTDFTLESDEKS